MTKGDQKSKASDVKTTRQLEKDEVQKKDIERDSKMAAEAKSRNDALIVTMKEIQTSNEASAQSRLIASGNRAAAIQEMFAPKKDSDDTAKKKQLQTVVRCLKSDHPRYKNALRELVAISFGLTIDLVDDDLLESVRLDELIK